MSVPQPPEEPREQPPSLPRRPGLPRPVLVVVGAAIGLALVSGGGRSVVGATLGMIVGGAIALIAGLWWERRR